MTQRNPETARRLGPAPGRPAARKARRPAPTRLPGGAEFHVVYEASRQRWAGTLRVGELSLTANAPSVFGLLSRLDRQYRKGLKS